MEGDGSLTLAGIAAIKRKSPRRQPGAVNQPEEDVIMTKTNKVVQMPGADRAQAETLDTPATIAPLTNVALGSAALQQAMNARAHLPKIVVVYGFSGAGKSTLAGYLANKHRAYYVEAESAWTATDLTETILLDMGIAPLPRIAQKTSQIAEELVLSQRPIIIDEFDHIVNKKMVEVVRDIYNKSHAPMLLLGEEQMPNHLRRWERFHRRVLKWQPMQPTDIEDVRCLARLYCDRVHVHDDLLQLINKTARGSAGRVTINLEEVREQALAEGRADADRAWWGDRPLYTGEAPARR